MAYPAAKSSCLEFEDCLGVTCEKPWEKCTLRLGKPFLKDSDTKEASAVKGSGCGAAYALPDEPKELLPLPQKPKKQPLNREPLGSGRAVVVVIAHNREDCLKKCLISLASQR